MPRILESTAIAPPSQPEEGRPALWSHGLALLVVAVAALLRIGLTPLIGPAAPFILFYPAVMVAGWIGGLRPGLTATAASAAIAWYCFFEPFGTFKTPALSGIIQIGIFLLSGSLLSLLNGLLHRSREAAEEQTRLLTRQQEEILRREEERTHLLNVAEQARQQAEEASRTKDQLLAVVSHELRTPLNAILGWGQLLTAGPVDPARLRQGLDAIVRSARHQSQLVDDLLDVSRIMSGKMRLDIHLLEPARVIEAAVEALRLTAEAKQIRLRTALDPQTGPVIGDPDRLQQVVWHLLSNAIKFTPPQGRVEVRLERVESPAGASVRIMVADNGIGISPQLLPYVFDPFRQLDLSTTRVYGGLGLGLSIVRNLVELHGGTVEARSAGADQGTTVVVHLPVARMESQDMETDEVRIPQGRPAPGPGGARPPAPPG